jgi:hypothetical protein
MSFVCKYYLYSELTKTNDFNKIKYNLLQIFYVVQFSWKIWNSCFIIRHVFSFPASRCNLHVQVAAFSLNLVFTCCLHIVLH